MLNLLQWQEVTSFFDYIFGEEDAAVDLAAAFDVTALESSDDPSAVLRDSRR